MEDWVIWSIGGVAALVAVAGVYSFFTGPNSPMASQWKRRLNELEVATRMGSPQDIIEALRESAKLYVKLGKRWEAETVLRRAMLMAKQEFGEKYEGLIPIMEDFARLMDSMHRNKEAENMRKDIERVKRVQKKD